MERCVAPLNFKFEHMLHQSTICNDLHMGEARYGEAKELTETHLQLVKSFGYSYIYA